MIIEESSFASKLVMQPKISKINKQKGVSIKGYPDLIKNHYNPGLRQIINTSKDVDELRYLIADTRTAFGNLNKIRDRIKLCKSQGENSKTSSYYKYIKKHYIDEGITEKDADKTIAELNKDIETAKKRIKELNKSVKEEFVIDEFADSDMDLLEMVNLF